MSTDQSPLLCLHQVQNFYKHSLTSSECLKYIFLPKSNSMTALCFLRVYKRHHHFEKKIMDRKRKREDNPTLDTGPKKKKKKIRPTTLFFMQWVHYQN